MTGAAAIAALGVVSLAAAADLRLRAGWCLGLGSLGPVRAGMSVEQVLPLADFPGLEQRQATGECWYLRYRAGGADFDLMIVAGRVARLELNGGSRLHTFSGAAIGSSESQLRQLYGARLEQQPGKYDPAGHTFTYRSTDGDYGLRFETSGGKVVAIQTAAWQHLHYVEGCG
jgi:hypothetical protein